MSQSPQPGPAPSILAGVNHDDRYLLRTLMDHLPDHIYFKDLGCRFTAVNRAFTNWMGFENPEDLIGKTDLDLFTEEHARQAYEDEQRIIRTGKAIIGMEEKETWPDGHATWVSTSKMPLLDDEGRIIGTFGLSRDITEQKQAREKIDRLFHELRVKNKTLEEDLEMARELQTSMLPRRYPCFPSTSDEGDSAVRFHHFYKPSLSVSGDFFDVLEVSEKVAGTFICDVMGHGVRAALIAAIVRGLLKEYKHLWAQPGRLLSELNQALCASFQADDTIFVSAFYALADLDLGEIRYANAGHPSPVCVHHPRISAAPHKLDVSKPGPALGLFKHATYDERIAKLTAGDVILMFTDGLFEVEGKEGRVYDYPDLMDAVSQRQNLPAAEMSRGVVEEFQRVSANHQLTDDMCLVAMEVDRLMPGAGRG